MAGIIVSAVLANETSPVQFYRDFQIGLQWNMLDRMQAAQRGNNCGGFGATADMLT